MTDTELNKLWEDANTDTVAVTLPQAAPVVRIAVRPRGLLRI